MKDLRASLPQTAAPKGRDVTDLSSVAKNLAFLAGIYLYFVGWAYLYLYFRHFGVSLLGLEIPVTFFFVYSYPLVTTGLTWTKFFLLVTMVGLVAAVATQNSMTKFRKALVLVLTLGLFPLSFEAADRAPRSTQLASDRDMAPSLYRAYPVCAQGHYR